MRRIATTYKRQGARVKVARCPKCGRTFRYIADHKPETCLRGLCAIKRDPSPEAIAERGTI